MSHKMPMTVHDELILDPKDAVSLVREFIYV